MITFASQKYKLMVTERSQNIVELFKNKRFMKKIVLLSLSILILGGFMSKTFAQIYMAAGQGDKEVNFQEVKTLTLNNASNEEVVFTKSTLQPEKTKADEQNCVCCDLSSPKFIAAISLNVDGGIVAMNMLGTKVYIVHINGTVQTINVENAQKTISEQGMFARMGTTPDGSIYALNNAGNQLVKITSDEQIEFLGVVKDYAEIFADDANKLAAFGGDIISDSEGNLYVFTAFGFVVKIDTQTMSAEYVGQINGLPEGYTINGAAVNEDNTIVLASSKGMGIYFIDINNLDASFLVENSTPIYDLASKYFLKTDSEINDTKTESEEVEEPSSDIAETSNSSISWSPAYPNPTSAELIIDKIEDNNIEKSKVTTKVSLYSHSTTKLVFSRNYPSTTKQIRLDTSKLPNGVYYLNMFEKGKKIKEQTIIVNH